MSDYIPEEIWSEILKRSPPDTLLRCRSVCKSWRSLISSPSFISSHLSSQQPRLIARENSHQNYVLFHPESLPSLDSRFPVDPHPDLHIIGTVNGLLCLANDFFGSTNTIVLWNPLIRRCVYLPPPIYSSPATSTLGIGLDPTTDDIKIVRIARGIRAGLFGRRSRSPPNAEVFSVRDWKWRPIDYSNMRDIYTFPNRRSQCLLNGAAHWVGYLRSTRDVLLAFRFETEEFKMIELPHELQRRHVSVSKVGKLLSVLDCKEGGICDVWAMKEYGEASSWCKMVSLRWEGGGLRVRDVLWVREDCGEVLVSTEGEEVFTYDPWNREAKLIGFQCKGDGCFADGFVGSLALFGG